ncbi:endolytic transglycosylase MltG [bacterium LRH843]|nr:endolytic transglycosylase MltG [bacterium LRH843]
MRDMSSKGLQYFAGGLFLATAILAGVHYLSGDATSEVPKLSQAPSIEEMKQTLETEGFIILSTEEMDKMQADLQQASETEAKTIYTMVLQVTAGMTSLDIAEQLVRGHIISDRSVFLDYVNANQLAGALRAGEYELNSNETIEEITARMTSQKQ